MARQIDWFQSFRRSHQNSSRYSFGVRLAVLSLVFLLFLPMSWVAAANSVKSEPLFEGIPLSCYVYNAKSSTSSEGNALDRAFSLTEIAEQYNQNYQFDRAKETLSLSLDYAKNSLASDRDKAYGLVQIAKALAKAKSQTKATEVLASSEAYLPAIFGRDRIFALLAIADGYREVGEPSKAIELLDLTIVSANSLDDKYAKGRILVEAAEIYGQIPEYIDRSQEILNQALEFTKSFGNSTAAARIQLEIATSYGKQGKTAVAKEIIDTALKSLDEESNSQGNLIEAIAYDYLTSAYLSVKNLEAAIEIVEQMPDSYNKALQLSKIANLQLENKQVKQAEANNQRSLEIFSGIEDTARITQGYSEVAQTYRKLGQITKAVELLKQGITIALRSQETSDKVIALIAIAETFDQIGQNNRAMQTLDQAYEIAIQAERKVERPTLVAAITGAFGTIGDYNRALDIARGTADLPARSQLMRIYECAAEVNLKN
jgi:tetratricopeptide (TPR) repeat protein